MAGASDINAGGAVVTIGGDASGLNAALNKAQSKLQAFGNAIGDLGLNLGAGAAVIGGLGATISAPFLYGLSVLENWGDETQRVMRQTGMSFAEVDLLMDGLRGNLLEPLSGPQFIAGMAAMNTYLEGARNGSEAAAATLREMGLEANALQSMSGSDRVEAIADGLQRIGDVGRRTAAQMAIFGRRNAFAMNLEGGSAGIRARSSRVEDLQGGALHSSASLTAANEVRLAFNEMKLATDGFWATLGLTAAPIMRDFYKLMTRVIVTGRQWAESFKPLLTVIFYLADKMILVGAILGGISAAMMTTSMAIGFLSPATALLSGAVGILLAGLTFLAPYLLAIGAAALVAWGVLELFGTTITDVWDAVVEFISGIVDAIDWIDVLTYVVIGLGAAFTSVLLVSMSPAIVVLGLVAAQAYLLYEAFNFVFDTVAENWESIKSFFSMIYTEAVKVIQFVQGAFQAIGSGLFGWLVGPFMSAFDWIASGFRELFGEFRAIVAGAVDTVAAVVGDMTAAFGGIGDAISAGDWAGAFEIGMITIQLIWERTKNFLLDTWYRVVFLFGSAWDILVSSFRIPLQLMLESVITMFYSFIQRIEMAVNTMIAGLNALDIPGLQRIESVFLSGGEGAALLAVRNALGVGGPPREQQGADRTRQEELQAQQAALIDRAATEAWIAQEQATIQGMGGGGPAGGGGAAMQFGASLGSFSAAALSQVGSGNYAERTAVAVEALVPGVQRVGDLLEGDEGPVAQ